MPIQKAARTNFQQAPVISWISKWDVESQSLYSPAQHSQNVTAGVAVPFFIAKKNLTLNLKRN